MTDAGTRSGRGGGRGEFAGLRWVIGGLLLLASVLNYVDRQAFSLLAPTVQADLGISDSQYGLIVNFFLAAYTAAYLLSGRVVDWVGERVSMALFVGWWSAANALTGLASGFASMAACRFGLGLGEAGGYTVSPKAVRAWFPPKERGVAIGLYSMGGALGATLAPWLVVSLAARYSWRGAFLVTGALGGIFVLAWLAVYRDPRRHRWLSDGERAYIFAGREEADIAEDTAPRLSEGTLWRTVLGNQTAWVLMAARMLTDPLWYFFLFWLPKYLHTVRGMDQQALARSWVVYLAADAGFLLGGVVSGYFIKRGVVNTVARQWVMAGCAVLTPLTFFIPSLPGPTAVFAVAMVIALAHAAWLTNLSAFIVDAMPRPILGTAFGFIAAGSSLGGIFMNQAVAWTVGKYSYNPCFYVLACLHPIGLFVIWKFARPLRHLSGG